MADGPPIPNPSFEVYGTPAPPVGPPTGGQRTAVSTSGYVVVSTDRYIALTFINSTYFIFLPLASAYPVGTPLTIQDESGLLTPLTDLVISRAGSDLIDGAGTAHLTSPYQGVTLYSNGASAWSYATPQLNNATITSTGTTGNQTINKPAGTLNIAAGSLAITCTNSLVTASSVIVCVIRTTDSTLTAIKSVVAASGSFVVTCNANATGTVSIGFCIVA